MARGAYRGTLPSWFLEAGQEGAKEWNAVQGHEGSISVKRKEGEE